MRSLTRAGMRTHFTPALWAKWLKRLNGPDANDPDIRRLTNGIAQFRQKLAEKEPQD